MDKYESHITCEPVYDERLEQLKQLVGPFGFRVADLLMRKRLKDTPERSQFDTFCTARCDDRDRMIVITKECVEALTKNDFQIWRYKVEETLLDVRLKEKSKIVFWDGLLGYETMDQYILAFLEQRNMKIDEFIEAVTTKYSNCSDTDVVFALMRLSYKKEVFVGDDHRITLMFRG